MPGRNRPPDTKSGPSAVIAGGDGVRWLSEITPEADSTVSGVAARYPSRLTVPQGYASAATAMSRPDFSGSTARSTAR